MKERTLKEFETVLENHPGLEVCRKDIEAAFVLLLSTVRNGGLIMTCGNGGSASDSGHIVGELMKGFKDRRPLTADQRDALCKAFPEEGPALADHLQQAIPAIALTDQAAISTAFANDVDPDLVFAQQVLGYGRSGDTLIGLSTSGNSKNVVNACKVAKAFGVKTIALTGEGGGALAGLCDVTVRVPACKTYRVQEYHLPVYHALCAMLEAEMF